MSRIPLKPSAKVLALSAALLAALAMQSGRAHAQAPQGSVAANFNWSGIGSDRIAVLGRTAFISNQNDGTAAPVLSGLAPPS